MIGVVSKDGEINAVREFFQLFKTPWEFYLRQHTYDVVIVTSEYIPGNLNASLLLIYSSRSTKLDAEIGVGIRSVKGPDWLEWDTCDFPVYGETAVFHGAFRPFLTTRGTTEPAGVEVSGPTVQTARIGYNLFEEVAFLLSQGQPPANAHVPTLDIHISLLRTIMASSGCAFVEVPPIPHGYDFMACLSHDVDFTGIRQHKFDRTMWGFLRRALVGSLVDVWRGRRTRSHLLRNWKAALSLPLVYLGWSDDFWLEFDRYLEIEKGLHPTYFFIPFKNCPGSLKNGPAPVHRAAKYDVLENKADLRKLMRQGCEIGLHGIDAWQSVEAALVESNHIRKITEQATIGVRMHWLYFDQDSPQTLDSAGFSYDSTFGYNDALGFRAGTTQVFRPLGVDHLLELPLNIQDTAMFYPSRMNLHESRAIDSCKELLEITAMLGGVLTVNWHTRSLSPERLWGDFYTTLLNEISRYRVWFGTAQEIVSWYRDRRALCFEHVQFRQEELHLTSSIPGCQPSFVVREYPRGPRLSLDSLSANTKPSYTDLPVGRVT